MCSGVLLTCLCVVFCRSFDVVLLCLPVVVWCFVDPLMCGFVLSACLCVVLLCRSFDVWWCSFGLFVCVVLSVL